MKNNAEGKQVVTSIIYNFKIKAIQMKKQQKQGEQIARIIERQQVISYKKKPSNKMPKESDDEIESANSLKSGVFSQDNVDVRIFQQARFSKKNTPLPELHREKKRMFSKNIAAIDSKQINNYLEKEVRQHDNLVLKQKNNHLTTENMKLKTKVMALEKQNAKLSKIMEEDAQKIKQPGLAQKDSKLKGPENVSLKMAIKNLRKQLDDQKKENEKIKWSIKFTRISELQCERDEILNETARLRQLLDDEMMKKVHLKVKQHGLSHLEQRLHNVSDKNLTLMRENAELQNKLKKYEDSSRKSKVSEDNEKNLNKMLFNARRVIREKEKQIETLKAQSCTEAKIQSVVSIGPMEVRSSKEVDKVDKNKRIVSKSAQKYRKQGAILEANQCSNCEKFKQQIQALKNKIDDLNLALKTEKEMNSNGNVNMGDFSREEIQLPSEQELQKIQKFLTFRFKAHHLSFDEAEKYLINSDITDATIKEEISVGEMAESLVAEPFSVISSRYLQVCLMHLFYGPQISGKKVQKIKLSEQKKCKKSEIINNFKKLVSPYEIMPQQKEEEMFIQIAELITNYHQHILAALNRKRNGEGTIAEQDLVDFFNEIELEKEFIDFIICQIILESLDLEHLNFYTIFEIFYMPTQGQGQTENVVGPDQPNKKKFQVDHSQIVKEEDEEYEESRSYIEGKQKTQSRREDDDLQQENSDDKVEKSANRAHKIPTHNSEKHLSAAAKQKSVQSGQNSPNAKKPEKTEQKDEQIEEEQDEYEQLFEEEKMDQLPEEEEKANEDEGAEEDIKPYMIEEVNDEYEQYKDEPVEQQ